MSTWKRRRRSSCEPALRYDLVARTLLVGRVCTFIIVGAARENKHAPRGANRFQSGPIALGAEASSSIKLVRHQLRDDAPRRARARWWPRRPAATKSGPNLRRPRRLARSNYFAPLVFRAHCAVRTNPIEIIRCWRR